MTMYRATKQIEAATEKYPAKMLSHWAMSKAEIENAVADGCSVFAIGDDGSELLIASPEQGLIEEPAFTSRVHLVPTATSNAELEQALNIILGGDVNGDPK